MDQAILSGQAGVCSLTAVGWLSGWFQGATLAFEVRPLYGAVPLAQMLLDGRLRETALCDCRVSNVGVALLVNKRASSKSGRIIHFNTNLEAASLLGKLVFC